MEDAVSVRAGNGLTITVRAVGELVYIRHAVSSVEGGLISLELDYTPQEAYELADGLRQAADDALADSMR